MPGRTIWFNIVSLGRADIQLADVYVIGTVVSGAVVDVVGVVVDVVGVDVGVAGTVEDIAG